MSNAALAFLAGMGGGYMTEKQRQEEQARRDKKDQREQDEHDARMAEVKRKQDADRAVREAAQPLTVNNGATVTGVAATPTTYDSADVAASDVRQANRLAELPQPAAAQGMPAPAAPAVPAAATPAPVVGGKAFPDAASAQAAATAGNAPQAVRARQVAALRAYDPERADRMDASGIQIDKATQEAADAAWRRKVAGAMVNGGHDGLAELVNSTEHGPAAGVKLKAVPSADGKTVTYNKVGPNGEMVPTGLTFTNDGDGIARAAAALDGAISPLDRVKMAQADAKEAREAAESASKIKKNTAEAGEADAKAGLYKATATVKTNAGADGKPYKLDEDDKLRLTTVNTRVRDAEKAYGEALGKLMPGDKPETSPAVQFAGQQLRAAKLDHLRTNIELGQIKPEAMVNQILGVAKSSQDVLKSLSELATVGGAEFSDQVAAQIQKTDAWKRLNGGSAGGGAPQTTAAKKVAAAPAGGVVLQPDGSYAPPGTKPRPAAAAGMPTEPAPGTPGGEAGKRLDEARKVLKVLRETAPGLAKGRDAIDAHAESVRAAEKELKDAEAAYQRMVEGQARPYFGAGRAAPAAAAGMQAGR